MRNFRRLRLLLVLPALLLGLVACSDDDGDGVTAEGEASGSASGSESESGSEAASGSEEEAAAGDYCDALRAFNTAVFENDVEEEATEEEMRAAFEIFDPLWTDIEESAPAEHADVIAELRATIDALGEGDPGPINADETSVSYFGLVSDSLEGCVDEIVEVTGVDYAFQGAPSTFPTEAGLRFVNDSENGEAHEFIIFKKAEGETRTAEEILNDPATEENGPGEFSGGAFAPPGATAGSFLDLAAGDYLAVCFIPVGGGEDGPPHFTEGMFAEFSVG